MPSAMPGWQRGQQHERGDFGHAPVSGSEHGAALQRGIGQVDARFAAACRTRLRRPPAGGLSTRRGQYARHAADRFHARFYSRSSSLGGRMRNSATPVGAVSTGITRRAGLVETLAAGQGTAGSGGPTRKWRLAAAVRRVGIAELSPQSGYGGQSRGGNYAQPQSRPAPQQQPLRMNPSIVQPRAPSGGGMRSAPAPSRSGGGGHGGGGRR